MRAGFPRDRPRAPVTVVRDRLIPNGSRLLGKYARPSDDLDLQRRDKLSVPRDLNCLKQDLQDLHDLQDYLPRNEHSFCNGYLFRSFRTYMSIEKQTCPCFQGPLGP